MLVIAVAVVAILGDQTAYFIGRRIGPALFDKEDSRFFKKHYVTESHAFFETRTEDDHPGPIRPDRAHLHPVLAGVSYMRYPVFLGFDIVGGILWGSGVTLLGYFLGNIPFVKNNFELVILLIVFLSILPGLTAVGQRAAPPRRAARGELTPRPDPVGPGRDLRADRGAGDRRVLQTAQAQADAAGQADPAGTGDAQGGLGLRPAHPVRDRRSCWPGRRPRREAR